MIKYGAIQVGVALTQVLIKKTVIYSAHVTILRDFHKRVESLDIRYMY